ncbi:hypothetical protein ACP70R_018327 [Stipagrostis hirtigluma subsp. patula]
MASNHAQWADLPLDLLLHTASVLECVADLSHMALMCTSWHTAAFGTKIKKQLPWLLMPHENHEELSRLDEIRADFYCFFTNAPHCLPLPFQTIGARFFGSYPGGWLFVAFAQNHWHSLLNLYSEDVVMLPDSMFLMGCKVYEPIVIRAATLSGPPENGTATFCAAIVSVKKHGVFGEECIAAIWRIGQHQATGFEEINARDLIMFNGSFYFLNYDGDLVACKVRDDGVQFTVTQNWFHVIPVYIEEGVEIMSMYLVESRGELLLVVRLKNQQSNVTSSFLVMEMLEAGTCENGHGIYVWSPIQSLDGRMLFVARGQSRSFEAADYINQREGVYFLDDNSFDDLNSLRNCDLFDMTYRYSSCDNGSWNMHDGVTRRLFSTKSPSNYSAPVWFFH